MVSTWSAIFKPFVLNSIRMLSSDQIARHWHAALSTALPSKNLMISEAVNLDYRGLTP
jgi:hypothetical protein